MKKKGFTLVEILTVVAILAILVLLILPAIIRIYRNSRIELFKNEIRNIYTQAQKQIISDSINLNSGESKIYASDITTNTFNEGYLELQGNSNLKYCILVDNNGNVKKLYVSNNVYRFSSEDEIELNNLDNIIIDDDIENDITGRYNCYGIVYKNRKLANSISISDEISLAGEEFYVVSSTATETVLLAKYSLNVDSNKQSSSNVSKIKFSSSAYWSDKVGDGLDYPGQICDEPTKTNCVYIYDENSNYYQYIENYSKKISDLINIKVNGKLMSLEEANLLNVDTRKSIGGDSYFLGTLFSSGGLWYIDEKGNFLDALGCAMMAEMAIRPIIVIDTEKLEKIDKEKNILITFVNSNGDLSGTPNVMIKYNTNLFSRDIIELPSTVNTISGFEVSALRNSDGAVISNTNQLIVNKTLNGYFTSADGGTKVIEPNSDLTLVSNVNGYTSIDGKWIRPWDTILYSQYDYQSTKLPKITKNGYICGWTIDEDGDSIIYMSEDEIILKEDMVMYGICSRNKSIEIVTSQNENEILIGDEIAVGNEHFYVVSSNETETVLLAKYNLKVGKYHNSSSDEWIEYDTNDSGYGLQSADSSGVTEFGDSKQYSESLAKQYVDDYLQKLLIDDAAARLLTKDEADSLGCTSNTCTSSDYSWINGGIGSTSFWLETTGGCSNTVYTISSTGSYSTTTCSTSTTYGVRPVIVVNTADIVG